MFQIKIVDKIKMHILYSMTFSENRVVYEIMSKNMVEPERLQMAIWWRVACLIIKGTHAQAHARVPAPPPPHTHTEIYCKIILIFHCYNGFVNAPQCYVIRTLSALLRKIIF
jgi:hypothetical protein